LSEAKPIILYFDVSSDGFRPPISGLPEIGAIDAQVG
jgi:hypothetical protein